MDFLGYTITKDGIKSSSNKFEAIQKAPAPSNKKELQAFLGLLNFYHSFLKDKATVVEPLHRLLDSSQTWSWSKHHDTAFKQAKALLTSNSLLVHFDVKKPIVLVCDASPYGIGAVLCHRLENGKEAPVAYYSRTLSKTERNYAQIDREALAVIAAVKRFHHFLYGLNFEVGQMSASIWRITPSFSLHFSVG